MCLLTKRSVDRPWILFEAGMAKGKLDTPILGVALGIELRDASSGPFAQFQNCGDDADSLTKLVFQLVNRIPNSEPDEDTIKFQVDKFRENAGKILDKINGNELSETNTSTVVNAKDIENSSARLFEEIKIMFQDLPSRIERVGPSESRKRKRRFYPGIIEELMLFSKNSKTGIKIALSLYKEKMPWIYDEGVALLDKLEASKSAQSRKQVTQDFEELLMFSTRHPLVLEFFIEDKDEYMLYMELPKTILYNIEHLDLSKSKEWI